MEANKDDNRIVRKKICWLTTLIRNVLIVERYLIQVYVSYLWSSNFWWGFRVIGKFSWNSSKKLRKVREAFRENRYKLRSNYLSGYGSIMWSWLPKIWFKSRLTFYNYHLLIQKDPKHWLWAYSLCLYSKIFLRLD